MRNEELTKMVIENSNALSRVEQKQDNTRELLLSIHKEMKDSFKEIKKNYVNKKEFIPVKTLVYGGVGTVLTTCLIAVLYLIIN